MWLRLVTAAMVVVAVAVFTFPRLTTAIDRHLVRGRFNADADTNANTTAVATNITKNKSTKSTTLEILHRLASDTAVGVHPRDAFDTVIGSAFPSDPIRAAGINDPASGLGEAIEAARRLAVESNDADLANMFALLAHAQIDSVFIPAAIDDVALIVGVQQRMGHDMGAATAQATFTARFLTWAPVVVLAMMIMLSQQMRSTLLWTPTILTIGIGVALNRIGATWIDWLSRRAMRAPPEETVVLTGHLAVSLRAGHSVIDSIGRWRNLTPTGTAVADAIAAGETLSEALGLLPDTTAAARLAQSIRSTFRDGTPVITTVHQLVADVRHETQRHTEAQMRRLPAQLSLPLVLCVLPSFLLLTIAPIAFGSIARLAPVISPALSTTTFQHPGENP